MRELENFVRRLVALNSEETLTVDSVDREIKETSQIASHDTTDEKASLCELVERHLADYFNSFGNELPPAGIYERIIREVEKPLLTAALTATRGNQIRAAELLGLNRNTLRSRIKLLNIQVFRSPAN